MQCYDRIVHNVAMLCMRSRGADPKGLHSLFSTLQNAEHSIMTGYGVSPSPTYGGASRAWNSLLPIMGILQGNGMGPFVWAIISSVILHCMMKAGHAGVLLGTLSGLTLMMVGYAFVDDCDLCYTARDNHTPAVSILHKFQAAVDCWEGLLRATGGALDTTHKTFWYMIDFKWHNNRWEYKSADEAPGSITMREADKDTRVELSRKEPHEAALTLGIYAAPNGQQDDQMEYLKDKGIEFAEAY